MKIIYHKQPGGNFGDDLNTWIWDEIFPSLRQKNEDVHLLGIGTLLQHTRLKEYYDKNILVLGTGSGYDTPPPPEEVRKWDIRFVRGPKTCEALKINQDFALCDSAILLAILTDHCASEKTNRPLFIPHVSSVELHDWSAACAKIGVDYVSPQTDSRKVIKSISSAKVVLAESLHAAIIADAFRIPWIPIRISEKFNMYKWHDWGRSLSTNIKVQALFTDIDYTNKRSSVLKFKKWRHAIRRRLGSSYASSCIERTLNNETPNISDSNILSDRLMKIENIIKSVEQDYF